MRDANRNPYQSSLFAIRYRLHTLLKKKTVFFHESMRNTFVDTKAIMYEPMAEDFMRRREEILSEFVSHFAREFTPDVVMQVVVQAEDAYLAKCIKDIDKAGDGKLLERELVSKENINRIMVVLQEPAPSRIKDIAALNIDPRGVFIFELEGRYFLPEEDTANQVDAVYREAPKGPSVSQYQRKLIFKVIQDAEMTLNAMASLPLTHRVSDTSRN
jgi:hypothetical protein